MSYIEGGLKLWICNPSKRESTFENNGRCNPILQRPTLFKADVTRGF